MEPLLPLCQGTDFLCSTANKRQGRTVQGTKPTVTKQHVATKRKKCVHFSLMSELYIFEYNHPSKTWYTDADYQGFKRDLKTDILSIREQLHTTSMEHGTANTTTNVRLYSCPVGIEHASSIRDMIVVDRLKSISIRSVLMEQNRQRVLGHHDPNRIASLYSQVTAEASERARKRGKFHDLVKFI